jgi:phosphoribosylanthranilate isomerase
MWVKICGITNEEDALMAVALGADAIGFVFAPSPRQVSVGRVRDICRRLPAEVMTIGVFRDQASELVVDTVLEAGLRGAQLHGHETPAEAAAVRPKVNVLIIGMPADSPSIDRYDDYHADALLLDGPKPGSGQVFDWALAGGLPSNRRLILSGGLSPQNVARGIEVVQPWGVDVSSGVESEPGIKDARKVHAFVREAREAFAVLGRSRDEARAGGSGEEPLGAGPFDWYEDGGV